MISNIDIQNYTPHEISQKLKSLEILSNSSIKNLLKSTPYFILRGNKKLLNTPSITMAFVNKKKLKLFSLPNFLWLIVALFLIVSIYHNLHSYWLTLKAYELSPASDRGHFNFSMLAIQIVILVVLFVFGFLPMNRDRKYIVQQLKSIF